MKWLVVICLLPLSLSAQILTPEEVVNRVLEHHPVARAANLRLDWADAQQMKARGGFDPKLEGDFRAKEYDGKLYYSAGDAGLKVPTPVGLDVLVGYQESGGIFLNPEATTPVDGLLGAGVQVNLGQGLLIDARRAALRQAEYAQTLGKAEQRALINQLVSDALMAYWAWFEAWHQRAIFEESVELANTRRLGVVESAVQGDKPFQDTLEAGIQVLNRQQLLLESAQGVVQQRAALDAFLWQDGTEPLLLNPDVQPVELTVVDEEFPELPALLPDWLPNHPQLEYAQAQLGQKEIELKWKREQLKPEIGLKYQLLATPSAATEMSSLTLRDATVGLDVAFPIFLRKERAAVRLGEIDLNTKRYAFTTKQRELELKSEALRATWPLMRERQQVQRRAVRDAGQLLNGERQLFTSGESSLFLVNQREQYFIQTQIKQVEILRKLAETRVKVMSLEAQFEPLQPTP